MNPLQRLLSALWLTAAGLGPWTQAQAQESAATQAAEPFSVLEEPAPMPPPPPVAPASQSVPTSFHQQIDASLRQWADALRAGHSGIRLEPSWQPVDTRLKLPPCPQLPTIKRTGHRVIGRGSVRISCPAPAWSLNVSISVKGFRAVVVSQVPLERGEPLQASGLALEEREVSDVMGGHFDSIAGLAGYTAKRSIPRGQVLTRNMLEAPKLVRKGQVVVLEAGSEAFSVRTEGTALTDGGLGDIIRVRNNQSGRVVEGTVAGEGRIRVAL